jgi:hypothetical protein
MMKPGYHLWKMKPKSSQSSGCTHIHQTSRNNLNAHCLPARKLMGTFSWTGKGCWWWNSCNKESQKWQNTKSEKKKGVECWHMVQCSFMTMHVRIQLLTLEHWWSISPWDCLTNLLTALILLWIPPAYLPEELVASQPFINNEIMKGVKKWLSSQTVEFFLTQTYKNVFPNMTSTTISAVTMLRSSWSVCIYFFIIFFSSFSVNSSPEVTFQIALIYVVPKTL